MKKLELRPKYKALRKQLSGSEIEEMSLAIANKLLTLPIWGKTYFHIFLPITEHHEVNTEFILHLLSGKDKEIIISKSDFTYLLTQKISITLSLIACLYSLFAIFILIKGKIKFKWLFLIINLYIFLVHLYGIYFDIEMHN